MTKRGSSCCRTLGRACAGLLMALGLAAAAQAAEPARCSAQDIKGEGACALVLGYAWNGKTCTGVSGCSCKGADCKSLFDNPDKCKEAYAHCE